MNSFRNRHILVLLSLFFCMQVLAQKSQYRFKHLNVSDGLSQNTINDIFQDSEGYLWIATQDGLNRYDGYEIKQYLPNRSDSTSISDNFIWNITEDNLGNLWICSRNAANRFNKRTGIFTKFYSEPSSSPNSITHKGDSTYILNMSTLYRLKSDVGLQTTKDSLAHHNPSRVNMPGGGAFTIMSTKNSGLLLFNPEGILFKNGTEEVFVPRPVNPGPFVTFDNRVVEAPNGSWVLAFNEGLYQFDPVSKTATPYLRELVNQPVYAVNFGPRNELWIATDNGIQVIDALKESIIDFSPLGDASSILRSEIAFSIFTDRNKQVWVGTSNNGMYNYDPHLDQFKFLNTQHGLKSEMIWHIEQVSEHKYWLGTEEGVTILTKNPEQELTEGPFLTEIISGIQELKHPAISGNRINMIYTDEQKNRWLGVHSKGLYIFNTRNQLIKRIRFDNGDPVANQITSVAPFGEEFWVTTFKGIYVLDKNYRLKFRFAPEGLNTAYFFKAFSDGNKLWFGGNTGFYSYQPAQKKLTHYPYQADTENSPGFYFVNDFAKTGQNRLWLATFGGGLDGFNEVTSSYTNFGQEEGLANNVVSSLVADDHNVLWLGTNRGISRFNPRDSTFINYNESDGIIFNETAINASLKNSSGEILIGTAGGLIVFHPDSLHLNEPIPKPKFTGFKINYEDVPRTIGDGATIDLYPSDKVLSLEFAALTFRNANRMTYEFKIDGIDDHWVSTDANNRRATYSTLPFGTHRFQIRAKNIDGTLSQTSNLSIIVHAPFWLTWWFISGLAFLILAAIVVSSRAYFKYRMKENLRKLELKQKIQAERERISRDLHDNVGAQITHIISSLDNMAFQADKQQVTTDKLEGLSDFTRSTMRFLRETIWVINQDAIPVSEFVDRIGEYGERITEHLNIDFKVKTYGKKDFQLNPTLAMNMFRVMQEGINNAIKHSQATQLELNLSNLQDQLKFSVQDNGVGFNGKEKPGHLGLQNMSERVEEMNGSFRIKSNGSGTTLLIHVPKSQITSNA